MKSVAVLSMHTSPLAQPGTGDGGGMNVYVRELCSALARSGTQCDVFTRSWSADLPPVVPVEPGLRVHHVEAGPAAPLPKERLVDHVEEFAEGVLGRLDAGPWGPGAAPIDAVHANYWLSGMAGHIVKHRLDLPLVCTFHTFARVKSEHGEPDRPEDVFRAAAEAEVIGCSDAVLASNPLEAEQIVRLYGADPDRVPVVAPGVDHAFFAPGDRAQARRALGLPAAPVLMFCGRIQPLKAADVAVRALGRLARSFPQAFLVVLGGPSGSGGEAELERLRRLVGELGLETRVRFVPPQPHELVSTFYRAAAACRTPVVAAAVGGLRSLVRHGETGFLIGERSDAAFAEAIAAVLSDPARAAAMSARAVQAARSYTWSTAAGALRRLHGELSAGRLVEFR